MKGSNGMKNMANKKVWKGSPKKESNNVVKGKAPVKFSGKSDPYKK